MARLDRDGYEVADLVLTAATCERIAEELPAVEARRGGVRELIAHPAVQRIVTDARFRLALRAVDAEHLTATRATLFDETAESNWLVQWHQDRVVDGADAPADVLESMLAVRIHLDASGVDNGPLRVVPRSHNLGKLSAEEIAALVREQGYVELAVPQGAILFLRPLLVHSSPRASDASHRRVLHIEFVHRRGAHLS